MAAAGGPRSQGFDVGAALGHVAERWIGQAQTLLDACAHMSNHLRYTENQHAADESHITGTLSGSTDLNAQVGREFIGTGHGAFSRTGNPRPD
jgi:hypothetical protein